jgi:putative ATP-binding cassette transporter
VVENMVKVLGVRRNIGLFASGFEYMIQLIPYLIVAPLYFRGDFEFGTVTQAAVGFGHVMAAFSIIVKEFQGISDFGAVVERLGGVVEVLNEEAAAAGHPAIEIKEDPARVAFEGLTLRTPRDGRLLIEDLTVEVPEGERLLVMGPNGVGRTSLLRAAAGLWTRGSGRVVRPPLDQIMFLPQQPYLAPGTLRDQLLYATGDRIVSDQQILPVLRDLDFEPVLERVGGLDVERDWGNVLSLSEQQTLALARLLLAAPRFAFLDEATSALEPARSRAVYEVLARTPISYVSVATDPGLMEYHDRLLELSHGGGWAMAPGELAASS